MDETTRVGRDSGARAALSLFVAVEIAAIPLYLAFGRRQWFYLDEWDYLAGRSITDVGDLFRPHNEHWSTLPIVLYRILYRVFGLRTYVPYQLTTILAHLIIAALLFVIMRRSEVNPWITAAAASLFALLGEGNQNIVWGFQIGFVAPVVLGLVHLLLADHDGPIDRRDRLGLLAGGASLLCSGVAVTMTAGVGLAVLFRRGWRAAAFHVAPLAVVYLAWWLTYGREYYQTAEFDLYRQADLVRIELVNAFRLLGQTDTTAVVLVLLLLVGLAAAAAANGLGWLRTTAAAPLAMLASGVSFLVVTSFGRSAAIENAEAAGPRSHYLHIVAALFLPALALAGDALVGRRRALLPLVVLVFLAAVPGNIVALDERGEGADGIKLGNEGMLIYPRLPIASDVPRSLRPEPSLAPEVTMGWLLDGVESGRVPAPGPTNAALVAHATIRVALQQVDEPYVGRPCAGLDGPVDRTLRAGESVGLLDGELRVFPQGARTFSSSLFRATAGQTINVLAGPVDVRFVSADPSHPAVVCG